MKQILLYNTKQYINAHTLLVNACQRSNNNNNNNNNNTTCISYIHYISKTPR